MKKEHTYIKCTGCKWQLENCPGRRDWEEKPCRQCQNTRLVVKPEEILCNLCGETMCPIGTMNEQHPHGLFEAKVVGGYDSYHLLDMNRYTFSFCEKCLRQLFIQCKIKPEVHDISFQDEIVSDSGWTEDQQAYEYKVWKDAGGFHEAYMNRKCNVVKDCPNTAVYTLLHNHIKFTEEALCEQHKDHKYLNSTLTKFIPNVLKTFL